MRHARPEALDRIELLLEALRGLPGFKEKSRGVFYFKSRAWLHFHEDPQGLFADLRTADGTDFERFNVTLDAGRERLLSETRARLAPGSPQGS